MGTATTRAWPAPTPDSNVGTGLQPGRPKGVHSTSGVRVSRRSSVPCSTITAGLAMKGEQRIPSCFNCCRSPRGDRWPRSVRPSLGGALGLCLFSTGTMYGAKRRMLSDEAFLCIPFPSRQRIEAASPPDAVGSTTPPTCPRARPLPGMTWLAQVIGRLLTVAVASNSIVEFKAVGLRAAYNQSRGNPKIVRHGTTGLVARPEDAEGLAQCLDRLSRDDGLELHMGQQFTAGLRAHSGTQRMSAEVLSVDRDAMWRCRHRHLWWQSSTSEWTSDAVAPGQRAWDYERPRRTSD